MPRGGTQLERQNEVRQSSRTYSNKPQGILYQADSSGELPCYIAALQRTGHRALGRGSSSGLAQIENLLCFTRIGNGTGAAFEWSGRWSTEGRFAVATIHALQRTIPTTPAAEEPRVP